MLSLAERVIVSTVLQAPKKRRALREGQPVSRAEYGGLREYSGEYENRTIRDRGLNYVDVLEKIYARC